MDGRVTRRSWNQVLAGIFLAVFLQVRLKDSSHNHFGKR